MKKDLLESIFITPSSFVAEEVILQAVVLVLLSLVLSVVYLFRANSLSNRSRLAALLPLMALTTMLIISIVKSSLALSLGLVGALSIVRFRAAIKDPEELAYIFLAISLGLGFGADQLVMTSTFFVVIIIFILLQSLVRGGFGKWFTDRDAVHLQVTFTKPQSLTKVIEVISLKTRKIKLTRIDQDKEQTMMFIIKPKSEKALDEISAELLKLDAQMKLTILQYQPLV